MADQRGQQNTHDTGSPTSRARDDLRTGSKKKKPKDQRDEGRDKKDEKDKQGDGEAAGDLRTRPAEFCLQRVNV